MLGISALLNGVFINASGPILTISVGIVNDDILLLLNAAPPIDVTVSGRVIDANDEHDSNTESPIILSSGEVVFMITEDKVEHPLKQLAAIWVTLSGIVIEVKLLQFSKALIPITLVFVDKLTVVKLVHPANIALGIIVILIGIVALVRLTQFSKIPLPKFTSLSGIVTDVNPEFLNAKLPILVTLLI